MPAGTTAATTKPCSISACCPLPQDRSHRRLYSGTGAPHNAALVPHREGSESGLSGASFGWQVYRPAIIASSAAQPDLCPISRHYMRVSSAALRALWCDHVNHNTHRVGGASTSHQRRSSASRRGPAYRALVGLCRRSAVLRAELRRSVPLRRSSSTRSTLAASSPNVALAFPASCWPAFAWRSFRWQFLSASRTASIVVIVGQALAGLNRWSVPA